MSHKSRKSYRGLSKWVQSSKKDIEDSLSKKANNITGFWHKSKQLWDKHASPFLNKIQHYSDKAAKIADNDLFKKGSELAAGAISTAAGGDPEEGVEAAKRGSSLISHAPKYLKMARTAGKSISKGVDSDIGKFSSSMMDGKLKLSKSLDYSALPKASDFQTGHAMKQAKQLMYAKSSVGRKTVANI